jgi:alpha-tubulin suppressor-like RCC1 family protein
MTRGEKEESADMKGRTLLVSSKALVGSSLAVLFWAGCSGQEGVEGGQAPRAQTQLALGTTATSVTGGRYHSLALASNGTVWAWGDNAFGQIGDGTTTQRTTPVQVSGLSNITAISTHDDHSLALDSSGNLWAWGYNSFGQVGDGTTTNRLAPALILTNVTAISAGGRHSLALRSNGTVWVWGENSYGQMGDGTTSNTPRTSPGQVPGLSGISAISAGSRFSLALASNGTVWSWGYNFNSELGEGTNITRLSPVQVSGLTNVVSISAGSNHSLAVDSSGNLWAWGDNSSGQIGNGTMGSAVALPTQVSSLSNVVTASAGYAHSLVQLSNGTLWGWGLSGNNQIGNGTFATHQLSPVQVSGLSGVSSLSAAYYHSLAVRSSDGTVWVWGDNGYGQLGTGNPFPKFTPFQQP